MAFELFFTAISLFLQDYTIENDANAVLLEQLRLESAREAFEHEMQEPSAFLASESLTVPRTLPNAADSQSYIGNNLEAAPISTTARISGLFRVLFSLL